MEKLMDLMKNNPNVQEFWAYNPDRIERTYVGTQMLKLVYENKVLRDQFKLVNNMTADEKKLVKLWTKLDDVYYRQLPKELPAVVDHLKAIPLHPANKEFVDMLKGNPLLDMIDEHGLDTILSTLQEDSPEFKKALNILSQILTK